MKDYTAMSEEKQQGYINRYAGKAKYTMYEDEKKIVLKRTTKNKLYYTAKYLVLGTIGWLCVDVLLYFEFSVGLLLRILSMTAFYCFLIFGRVIHFFLFKVEILKNKRYLIVTREWKKPAKIPIDRSYLSIQQLLIADRGTAYHYGVVYNDEMLFMMLDNRPEFKRIIEFLESIGFTLNNKRWEMERTNRTDR